MKHQITQQTNVFRGVVTNIALSGQHGQQNNIIIHGASPTVKLDGKKTLDSFINKNLSEIANEVVANSGNGAEVVSKAKFTRPIDYVCQYGESTFEFFNRLSWLYGEWFFYDGNTIYFGKPDDLGNPINLQYDVDMTKFNLEASLLPPKVRRHSYLMNDDEERDKESQPDIPSVTGYLKASLDRSEAFYPAMGDLLMPSLIDDTDLLPQMVNVEKTRIVANMLIATGETQTCAIQIGGLVTFDFPSIAGITTTAGTFLITCIEHKVDQKGYYSNSFASIPASMDYIPMEEALVPIAVSQQATVTSNADPKGFGRMQVQFQWQKAKGKTTSWIRVQSPDAGKSDKVGSNRGLVTIPEEGETVMVCYEYGDPSRPYTSGSVFSVKTGEGEGEGNKTKSLTSRSGNTIVLDDEVGSVLIRDKSGSERKITLDGEKNIKVESDKSCDINVGKGKCILKMSKDGKVSLDAKAEIKLCVNETNTLTMTPNTTTLETTDKIDIKGEKVKITGSESATFKQSDDNQIKITSGLVDIDGGQVQIN